MSAHVNTLVKAIMDVQAAIVVNESDIVINYAEIGSLLLRLKRAAASDWQDRALQLGYQPRHARRFMMLGRSWWANGGLTESGLVHHLPPDLEKLSWLCRLSSDQLAAAIEHWPCRKWSRTQVTDAVKHELKIIDKAKPKPPVTVDRITTECEQFVEKWLEAIQDFGPEMADRQTRQRLLDELTARFSKLENALSCDFEDDSQLTNDSDEASFQSDDVTDEDEGVSVS